MNCKNCGATLSGNARFCASCGADQSGGAQTGQTGGAQPLVGYSDKINDPLIVDTLKKMSKSSMLFTLALAVAAVIGFSVAGALEVGGFALPSAFFFGLDLGGLLIVLALFQRARGKKDGTWDGVVIDKTYKEASYAERQSGDHRTRYSVHIRREDGSVKKLSCTEELFHYYQVGEHVRHHGGTVEHVLEKYDKSGDSVIYCIVCSTKNEIQNDICRRCKSPLLK
jgi:uncharacterized membrane protein